MNLIKYSLDWTIKEHSSNPALKYVFFWGHTGKEEAVGKHCFSQWYPAPFTTDGTTYATAEHWMMAQKALLFDDKDIFERIVKTAKPAEVKELGRQVKNFIPVRWDEEKYRIVTEGNLHKFSQHEILKQYLLQTAPRVLVEASPVDKIWGIGMAQDHPNVNDPAQWQGENLLGFALMEVRDLLQSFAQSNHTDLQAQRLSL